MGIEVVVGAALLTSVASSYQQYRNAKRAERKQEKQENIQAGLAEINNRREAVRRIARERVARANAIGAAEARGAGGGDSAVEGQVGGLRSSLGTDISQIFSQQVAGEQLSALNKDIAGIQTDSARAQAVGTFANTIFQGAGGFKQLFSQGGGAQVPQTGNFLSDNPNAGSTDIFSSTPRSMA